MQAWIDQEIRERRSETLKASPQITLGALIRQLEAIPPTYEGRTTNEPKHVWFDFGQTYPSELMSWRGSYAELAIGFDFEGRVSHRCADGWTAPEYMTAERFLAMLRGAVGTTYTGYKGGEFTMGEDTPVWVANYGDSGNTGVVGVRDLGWSIVIDTAWCEY